MNSNLRSLRPLGYVQMTSLAAATALTSVPTGTSVVLMKAAGQPIRFRDDGTNPTASVGYPLAVGAEHIYEGGAPIAIRVIETAPSATLDVLYYG